MCENEILFFLLGEREYIDGEVRPRNPKEIVVITDSTYEITQKEALLKEGKCEIDGNSVRFLFTADTVGEFTVKITASVGAEKVITKRTLVVRE